MHRERERRGGGGGGWRSVEGEGGGEGRKGRERRYGENERGSLYCEVIGDVQETSTGNYEPTHHFSFSHAIVV